MQGRRQQPFILIKFMRYLPEIYYSQLHAIIETNELYVPHNVPHLLDSARNATIKCSIVVVKTWSFRS